MIKSNDDVCASHLRRSRPVAILGTIAALLLAMPALADDLGKPDFRTFQSSHEFPDFQQFDEHTFDRDSFQFAVMGDTGYTDEGVAQLGNMTDDINAQRSLKWVIHNGDIKGGQSCDDTFLQGVFNQFQKFNLPLVYAPGDNEWTDCHMPALGKFLPTERLTRLRQIFFPFPGMTIGKHPMRVTTQGRQLAYSQFVEHVRWVKGGVVFATVNVPGSGNDLNPWLGIDPNDSFQNPRPDRIAEFKTRMVAVFAWLDETFALAERIDAPGVYISMQADPLFEVASTDQRRAGFNDLIEAVRAHAVKFGREVVLAHGDSHTPRIDKPLMSLVANPNPALPPAANMRRVENFTRIENYGPPDTHWLRVTVDPDGRQVFKTELMTVAKNRNTFAP